MNDSEKSKEIESPEDHTEEGAPAANEPIELMECIVERGRQMGF